jgi:chaperonin cofactor prefoldin
MIKRDQQQLTGLEIRVDRLEDMSERFNTEITQVRHDVSESLGRLEKSIAKVSEELSKLRVMVMVMLVVMALTSENAAKVVPLILKLGGI